MIAALNSHDKHASSVPLTNKVIKILSMHGNLYKTFGENIILLINREGGLVLFSLPSLLVKDESLTKNS